MDHRVGTAHQLIPFVAHTEVDIQCPESAERKAHLNSPTLHRYGKFEVGRTLSVCKSTIMVFDIKGSHPIETGSWEPFIVYLSNIGNYELLNRTFEGKYRVEMYWNHLSDHVHWNLVKRFNFNPSHLVLSSLWLVCFGTDFDENPQPVSQIAIHSLPMRFSFPVKHPPHRTQLDTWGPFIPAAP